MPNSRKSKPTQRVQRRDLSATERVRLALKLRAARMTYDQIAEQCGYDSRGSAYKAVQRELQRNVSEDVEEMRKEELAMLDQLQQEVYKRMADKDYGKSMLFAVDRLLAISERRARLTGMDKQTDEQLGVHIIVQEVPAGYLEDTQA